jgi:superfamily II DNA or RNA helicase
MPLASKVAFHFHQKSIILGRELFLKGAVTHLKGDPRQVTAKVLGGAPYEVSMRLVDQKLLAWCDCPYFQGVGPCKHLWALTLEADRHSFVSEALDIRNLAMQDDSNPDLGNTPEEEGEGEELHREPAPPFFPDHDPRRVSSQWEEDLRQIQRSLTQRGPAGARSLQNIKILYGVELSGSSGGLALELFVRSLKKNGEWSARKDFRIAPSELANLPDPLDIEVLSTLFGSFEYYYSESSFGGRRRVLSHALAARIIPPLARSERLVIADRSGPEDHVLAWDEGAPWEFHLTVRRGEYEQWSITGSLRRGEETMSLDQPLLITEGFVFTPERVARLADRGSFAWISELRRIKRIRFPDHDREKVLGSLLTGSVVPHLDLDDDLKYEERRATPRLGLRISRKPSSGDRYFDAQFLLDYGDGWTRFEGGKPGYWLPERHLFVRRDQAAESSAIETLAELGMRQDASGGTWRLNVRAMPSVVRHLLHAGWHVDAEGKIFRRPGSSRMDVRSGIDWFELHGEVDYEGTTVKLPDLLAALRRGDNVVPLSDGGFGLLPEEWLERFAPIAGLGTKEDDHLRFGRNQAGLLDALLAAQPEIHADEIFERLRERLKTFEGVRAAEQPAGFQGRLRDYQKEGLGWIGFLRECGFGGCLADDMGVGKTAQVLAALEARRAEGAGPSLVVAPKSLMFNWRAEAERFTPNLRVLEHTGMTRDVAQIAAHDVVLTTYGTMLRDAAQLAEVEFDYVVLDEAQAIKNASTASAKAVRLLRGRHRLALSGTPIENHLGELWSLFEFLNPGMLGESRALKLAGGLARNPGEDARRLLAQALRPFILRRTKQQVAKELPEKTEQTIFCDLEPAQRAQYDDLLRHYRGTLLGRIDREGINRVRMHVLEALLRLRQAACHCGLLDSKRIDEPSAKVDLLLDQLAELQEEGHKALVFSQFTSLLAIVRKRLDEAGLRYEYLDGSTTNRAAHVDVFQNDEDCRIFLISLKAGGLGLNLTAAEYVFLLDPWWNPAVEAQAIDRAHRIGQTRPVFAYRLIARETVEEKVLELQKNKRELADAILGEDHSLVRDLKREDLELLLS